MVDVSSLAPEDADLWEAMGSATPRWSHLPTPGAEHELRAVRMVAKALGKSLLPWQEWVVRVGTEKLPNGRYRFPEFLLTVPRQSGKTLLITCVLIARGMMCPGRRSFYTAQTGKDGSNRWKDMAALVANSPFKDEFQIRYGIGSQSITFSRNLSRLEPFAPTPTSLHGYTPHDVALDEIFSFDGVQGNDLMGAIKPAQQTLKDRQLIMLSTAGHMGSVFLKERVDTGRVSAETNQSGVGYVEWSLTADHDPYDEQGWSFHPSLGHLIEVEDLRELAKSTPKGEWQRAFLNQWVDSYNPLFDMTAWKHLTGPLEPVSLSHCVLAFSQASDSSRGVVVAAWWQGDRIAIKLVLSDQDIGGFAVRVAELAEQHKPLSLCADDGGLDRRMIDSVNRALPRHMQVEKLSPREWELASVGFDEAIANGVLIHANEPHLTAAVAGAVSKRMKESWAISHSSRPEVIAAAAAVRMLESKPAPLPKPEVYFGTE